MGKKHASQYANFGWLPLTFKCHLDEYYSHFTLEGKVRQRISYNRKTSVLPLIQELHAIQFEMTQPQANRWIHLLSEILRRTLKTLAELPDRNSKRLVHILQGYEEVLLDGTERPIQRPLDEDRQSACYSGKKTS